jgi:hypothetical protein
VKSGKIVRRGQITTEWSERRQRLRTAYSNRDFQRSLTITVSRATSKAVSACTLAGHDAAPDPAWLPDLTVRDLRIGKHKLDIRFWTEGGQTSFEVTKGDPELVERCDIASKAAQLRVASDLI